ncbi:copper amine oxidase N-terminal domain-containing protein [Paenibacillus periandrae]|uniref:copper amine oxidase N-terminal domain-containing protein n=1 Tax=Paenibacillus periandrae TaxID=1761741 RepID=UPI001F0993F1|nr:copper amine oxidase N-terminal domain-containing protein [Paenibacillus periandrae]
MGVWWNAERSDFNIKKFMLGLIFGLCLSLGSVVYASDSIQSILVNVKFVFNGIKKDIGSEYSVMNYQGHIYVPIRFIAENMPSSIDYDDHKKEIRIEQNSVKIEKGLAAPVPFVYYERKYQNGTLWNQEIPILLGSSCWKGCVDVIKPYSHLLKMVEYQPVTVAPGSSILIQYPKGMEPSSIKIIRAIAQESESDMMSDRFEDMIFENHRILLPDEPGTYTIWIKSLWAASGDTSYIFAVEIK